MAPAEQAARPLRDPAALARVASLVRPVALARDQVLPVLPALEGLLPGLQRGTVVGVRGPAATSLVLALAAGPSAAGSWTVAVGLPSLGLLAAAELGVALARFVLVAPPGPEGWGGVVATAADGFDVVLLAVPAGVHAGEARRVQARVRERATVLLVPGDPGPLVPDVTLEATDVRWEGLGEGHGHLRSRRVEVTLGGRRAGGRARHLVLWLPDHEGRVRVAEPAGATPAHLPDVRAG